MAGTDTGTGTTARVAVLETKFEAVLRELAELRQHARGPRAATTRRAHAAYPPDAQLCSCVCGDDACLNCPNSVAARWEEEQRRPCPAAGFEAAKHTTVPAPPRAQVKKRRVETYTQVNRPESAGEEEVSDGEGGRQARRKVVRKLGCFPTEETPEEATKLVGGLDLIAMAVDTQLKE
jgi:hypothetical protein